MKALLTSILLGAFAIAACANDAPPARRTIIVRRAEPATVTGSNIARNVKRIGNTYDTPQNVYVIDRERIDRTGATTVADVLRRVPFVGIR
jgi:outer membrane cobalamin receptor